MRKQTFLYRFDPQEVRASWQKHRIGAHRGSFFTSFEIFSGFSGMGASTTVIYWMYCTCFASQHLFASVKRILSASAIITCSSESKARNRHK